MSGLAEAAIEEVSEQEWTTLMERPDLDAVDLSLLLEKGGEFPRYFYTLVQYTTHTSPLVREGVVYGLGRMIPKASVPLQSFLLHLLERHTVADYEPSKGVRQAALDTLESVYDLLDSVDTSPRQTKVSGTFAIRTLSKAKY